MPIYRYTSEAYGPDEIRVISEAYENALHALRLVDRNNPVEEIVARKIIEIWETGERDAYRIAARAFEQLGETVGQAAASHSV